MDEAARAASLAHPPPCAGGPAPAGSAALPLLALTLAHFAVDFYGGLTVPLAEPTLTRFFRTDIGAIGALVGGAALLINVCQPVAGWLLPRRGLPGLIWLCPPAAALAAGLGLTGGSLLPAALLLAGSALGIGLLHPEGALAAHGLTGRRPATSTAVFLSGGAFGFAAGNLAGGLWGRLDPDLARFWWLALPALPVALLAAASRLARTAEGGGGPEQEEGRHAAWPFGRVLGLAAANALFVCLLVRLLPLLTVRRFGPEAQAWGGAAVFALVLGGALGGILWSRLAEGRRRGRAVCLMQALGAPFLFLLLGAGRPQEAPLWALGLGLTGGAAQPLIVVLARGARGLSRRLRLGLAIGGAWGLAELAFIAAARYLEICPAGAPEPVAGLLGSCWLFAAAAALCGWLVARRERG